MFANTLSPDTLRGIKLIGQGKWLDFAYLAGGTALALRLGHRQSVDLDFFTPKKFDEQVILMQLKQTGRFESKTVAWRTVIGDFFKVSFSLFYYEYSVLDKTDDFFGIKIASLKDIAAMKIHAIEDRGSKRDFVDLFFLTKTFSLREMLNFYGQKYHCLEKHKLFILKGMNYFEDAESEKMRPMFKEVDWDKLKQYFQNQVKQLAKEWGIL
ncbi:MAG: nucleotidyl transferase AbiEii/AbiGii toxin family protein [Candidatus Beckwithbacteria bacterium]|nr:nucleotidyl transferase AbiEii/AbiGii toxin family protein [Candidatus Beckwithbacteria bacterium]